MNEELKQLGDELNERARHQAALDLTVNLAKFIVIQQGCIVRQPDF